MTDEHNDFLETDCPVPEIAAFNQRFRNDPRGNEVIASLRRRGMSDLDIAIAFRLIARIPREWEIEKEPHGKAVNRRATLAEKLKNLASEIENDPDLSGLCFGVTTISYGTPKEDREGLVSLADCIREGMTELELQSQPKIGAAGDGYDNQKPAPERTIAIKRFAIREVFALIDKPTKRAPNKETAVLTSILLREDVTPNDVTQARKSERRQYYRE